MISINVPSWANHHSTDSSTLKNAPISGDGERAYTSKGSQRSKEDHSVMGGRQCGNQLVALAPRQEIGVTTSKSPTFVWSVEGKSPNKQSFYLFKYNLQGEKEEIYHDETLALSQSGINSYTLPQGTAELEVGKTYIWQVAQHCKKNIFDGATSASINRQDSSKLISNLPTDPLQKAQVYARSGIWYDALAIVYNATSVGEKDFRKDLILDLVDQEPDLEVDPKKELGFKLKP